MVILLRLWYIVQNRNEEGIGMYELIQVAENSFYMELP